ncbi:O-antigen ligase family protein [Candidatus Uhrbacteria bacterium]|nr:O-antigen ligase family protein [Candidatus Uhrbacteria bacterium]
MLTVFLILTSLFAVLTWKDLHKGLFLLTALLPSYLLRTYMGPVPTTLLELLILTFVIIWFIKRNRLPFTPMFPRGIFITILLLILAATISIAVSSQIVAAVGIWKAYFIEPFLLFFIISFEIRHNDRHVLSQGLFKALGVSAMVIGSVAIIQWITGAGLPIPWDIERRVTSVFDYPNAVGLFLGPIFIIGFQELIAQRITISFLKKNLFWIFVCLLSFTAIILAQSEAAVVAVVATVVARGLFDQSSRKKTILLGLLATLVILISPWLGLVIQKLTLQDYSGGVRLSQWTETVELLKDHWVLGAGLSGYQTALIPYHRATHFEIFQYPHNILLNIWVELGLLGVIAFFLLTYSIIKVPKDPISTIAFFALLEMTIHGLVDVPYFKNDLAVMTWILIAITLKTSAKLDEIALNGLLSPENPTQSRENGVNGRP